MKIYACPKCGSKNIHVGTMDSGVTYGITSWDYTCKDCDYKGQPIIFDSEKEYKKFLVDVKHKPQEKDIKPEEKPSVEEQVDEVIKDSKKDKEVVELLMEYEKEKVSKPIWPKKKVWWPEIGLALIIAIIVYFSGFVGFISLMGMETAIIVNTLNFIIYFL